MNIRERIISAAFLGMILTAAAATLLYGKIPENKEKISVTISVTCDEIADDGIDPVMLSEKKFNAARGTVLSDIMKDVMDEEKISIEYTGDEYYKYVTGIGGIRQFDYGKMSGWYYTINGETSHEGSSSYCPSQGDVIEWKYSRNLEDIQR